MRYFVVFMYVDLMINNKLPCSLPTYLVKVYTVYLPR